MNPLLNPLARTSISVPQAIMWGGIVAGVLDALDAVMAFGFLGMNPREVLQYIASAMVEAPHFLVRRELGMHRWL